jgi:Fic family protein
MELLQDIHTHIALDTMGKEDLGQLRNQSDNIVVYNEKEGNVVFTPPPAQNLSKRLKALFRNANEESTTVFVHPIVKATVLHFWLAYEHPFKDGDGRVARSLFYWYLLRNNYWLVEYISISAVINTSRMKYYESFLHSEHDDLDITYFLLYMLDATNKSMEHIIGKIQQHLDEWEHTSRMVEARDELSHRHLDILNTFVKSPTLQMDIEDCVALTKTSWATARSDLMTLNQLDYLKKVEKGRRFVYLGNQKKLDKLR